MSNKDGFEDARGRAQDYVDAAESKQASLPRPQPIDTAPREPGQPLLLFCPEQDGWHTGEWHQGEWTDALTRSKHLDPTHWIGVPENPAPKKTIRE
jgi:hypothetical protein